jgi:cyclopropane fatty-acyl-phospholipid synthase-like methyltransferase
MICRKLYLKPGMHLLDIGCGWGAFGKYAAEKYNCEVVGITVSKNQVELGRKLCDGLPVEFLLTDYDKTLMAWYYNFEKNWDEIKKNYSERFFRMWKYFLLSAAGSFRSRIRNQLWQIVLSKNGIPGGYQSIR